MQSVAEQSFRDFQHIIVDGNSHDGTPDIARANATANAIVVSEPDKGLYDAMNKGIGLATGKYLIFLNAGDCFYDADTLARYAQAANTPDCNGTLPDIIYGQTVLADSHGHIVGNRHLSAPRHLTLQSFSHGMLVCHQAFCVLRRIAPLYNTDWRFSADFEWCIRCLQHSRLNVYLGDKPVIKYLSEGITTANRRASLIERFKIMCHYYGTVRTIARHVGFIPRAIIRKACKNSS